MPRKKKEKEVKKKSLVEPRVIEEYKPKETIEEEEINELAELEVQRHRFLIADRDKRIQDRSSFFSGEVEFYNGEEWKPISKYGKFDKVLTFFVGEKRECKLLDPIDYITSRVRSINHFQFGKVLEFSMSDGAILVGENRDTHIAQEVTYASARISDFNVFTHTELYSSFYYEDKSSMMTKEAIEVMIYSLMFGEIKNNNCILPIPQDKKYFKILITRAGIKCTEKNGNYLYRLPRDKEFFIQNPLNFSLSEVYHIVDVYNRLRESRRYFYPTNVDSLDFFQMIFAMSGQRCDRDELRLTHFKNSMLRLQGVGCSSYVKRNKAQYAFTVQSGFYVVRINGVILVVGDAKR